jgi:hypothetical protein
MRKRNGKPATRKNGAAPGTPATALVKQLMKYRDRYLADGGKLLNRRELERELAEIRGSR